MVKTIVTLFKDLKCYWIEKLNRKKIIDEFFAVNNYFRGKIDIKSLKSFITEKTKEKIEKVMEPKYLDKKIARYKRMYIGYFRYQLPKKGDHFPVIFIYNEKGITVKDLAKAWKLYSSHIPDSVMYVSIEYVFDINEGFPLYQFNFDT